MRSHALLGTILLTTGCLASPAEPAHESLAGPLPPRADAVTDEATAAQRAALLARIGARLPAIRRLKEDLTIGETHDGQVAEPDVPSPAMDEPSYAWQAWRTIEEENADRALLYAQALAGYRAELEAQNAEQAAGVREQIATELCARLPAGTPCEQIEAEVVERALSVALQAALDAALEELVPVIARTYAEYWQRRTTRPGEWIEIETASGTYEWVPKPGP